VIIKITPFEKCRKTILEPLASVNNNQFQQFNPSATEQAYALILNPDGKALVRQTKTTCTVPFYWTMFKVDLPDSQDPLKVAREELFTLGYESGDWVYLGSYANAGKEVIHFLFARDARAAFSRATPPPPKDVNWVSLRDLRYALLDGRIGQVGDATSIALAMFLMTPP
jgi:hypothetical protein